MRDHLIFYVNGVRHAVGGGDAFLSLSDFLRLRLGLVGTKIVCSEGDCGACTVLIGRVERDDGARRPPAIRYRPVDSCIQFLFQLDATHIVTVEGLRSDGELNAVQQAMIDCHGSQCGFCTPGFVMAMTGLQESHDVLDAATLRAGLSGNLCRCTGYAAIIEAGVRASCAEPQRLDQAYPPAAMLAEFERLRSESVTLRGDLFGETHLAACPATLADSLELLSQHPMAVVVAGGTDVGVRINKSQRLPAVILDLNRVADLDYVRLDEHALVAGARATWTSLLAACCRADDLGDNGARLNGHNVRHAGEERRTPSVLGELARIVSVFGGPQIRHVGTIAGNIANASPIADSLPLLHVMEATLVLASVAGRRQVNINDFYLGYKKLDLRPGELITEIRLPLADDGALLRLYKVSRRRDLDISSFTAAIRLKLDGDDISHASIALGAVGPTVIRPVRTERYLVGQPFCEATFRAAGEMAADEATPIDDVRGAAEYRRQLIRNVFLKFYHQRAREACVPVSP